MWTRADVERWMVTAERADPRVRNPGESRPLGWLDRFVADPEDRAALKLWVWCEAHGHAFSAACKARDKSPSTWTRRRQRAAVRITMLLNLEDGLRRDSHLVAGEI